MNKFHQIPTEQYNPISHEKRYLFEQFDKIANFLTYSLDKKYKNILGKPVQNGYVVDWFSVFGDLKDSNTMPKSESVLLKYWEFIDVINIKISQLSSSNDENDQSWAEMLKKVFNHQDNFIFSNGEDICIIWGWKFNNNQIFRPAVNILSEGSSRVESNTDDVGNDLAAPILEPQVESPGYSEDTSPEPEIDTPLEFEDHPELASQSIQEEHFEESSFAKFLKWFASKFWWLLWFILILIILSLLLKSCTNNDRSIDNKLDQLEKKANECCG